MLAPVALALSALAIPIILLYMLRLRRTETPISSTFLWQQLVRDREANAPWQRLRFSWLLLLQLLILAALVLALARPFAEVETITSGRIVLLLDASASMQATDVQPSRFAAARAIGLDMVDTLGPDDTMTVIQVSDVPEVLASASRDRLVLRNAIRSAQAGDVSADWSAAMTLAAAGAVGVEELNVVVVSDGGLPDDLPLVPGDVRFVPVGDAADNLAISALATAALPGRPPQLFAQITNYGDVDTDVILDIRLDESSVIFQAQRYTVPANSAIDVYEIELPETFDSVTARLTLPGSAAGRDYLRADDVAYAVPDRSGAGRVLLATDGNIFLRQILRSLRGVELVEIEAGERLPQQPFDLYVFDGWLPDPLPDGDLLLVNPPESTAFFQLGETVLAQGTVSANRSDPRTRNLGAYTNTINLDEYRLLSGVEWAIRLLSVDGNPLVVVGERDGRQVAILPFDARYPNTDLVLQPGWPILMSELAGWFSPPRVTNVHESLPPGAPVAVRFIEDADEIAITRPDSEVVVLPARSSEAVFVDTLQPGLYDVALRRAGDTIKLEQFAVNLFDANESRIAPVESVTIGTETVTRNVREETGRRELWPWVAGIGLLVLLIEWWVYHRSLQRLPRLTLGGLTGDRRESRLRSLLGRRGRGRKPAPFRTR